MKKILSTFLVLAIVLSLLAVPVSAVGTAPSAQSSNLAEHYFYDQLTTAQAKAIYNALWDMFDKGTMKDGKSDYDLVANGIVTQNDIRAYLDGDRTLFNNFAAAKDAFDLEHPEAWYMDSSYLSFRVTQGSDGYHAYIGPGRSDNYYVYGVTGTADVEKMTAALNVVINDIISGAEAIATSSPEGLDAESVKIKQVQYVHKRITEGISYRLETDCEAANVGFIRTVYGLVTHEGVCEAYARSMQLVLNKLSIPCVPIHGLQTSGTPERHMWNAVQIAGKWYVVDATWDDPVPLDASGNIIKGNATDGRDNYETEKYLLVGQDVVRGNWQPSGYVSTGTMEFKYPEIASTSLSTGITVTEGSGLTVIAIDSMMNDVKSTEYRISYNGDGLVEAAKKGYYFLNKLYKKNADGTVTAFQNWYYLAHGLHGISESFDPNNNFQNTGNPYFFDSSSYLTQNLCNVDYVEFAVTKIAPPDWKSADDLLDPDQGGLGGYFTGDDSDIIAQTGRIYNPNGGYDPPPYVMNASPQVNSPVYVGRTYNIHIEFTDELYHPDQASIDSAKELGKLNDAEKAMAENVTLYYEGITYSWGVNARQPHKFANKPVPTNVRWTCKTHDTHTGTANADGSIIMSGIGADCKLTAIDFNFAASRMWADDSIQYEFHLTGLIGIKSNKYVIDGGWSYVFENESAFCAYRCYTKGGIDWNLWGQPQLLDSDIDLSKMVVEGVDGKQQSLADLQKQMHLDDYDMNGRLMLVAEQFGNTSEQAGQLKNAMNKDGVPTDAIKSSSLYEIDFARICQKTIVKTGDSLRLSVGFPEGIDASMSGVVFKAYHFVRNEKTSEIIRVEEIPVTVTPYGLVIMCNSFSPFAIVALDASKVEETPSAEKTVMILAEEGGAFLRTDGTAATGAKGVVTLKEGQHVTLKVQPNAGQAVSSVTFDGHPISVSSDGTVVIAYEDIQSSSCILSASFVSAAVQQVDKGKGMTSVVADTSKTGSSKVSERLKTAPGTAPESSTEVTSDSESESPFVDVKTDAYYFDAVLWAYEKGVTTGTGDGSTFSPLDGCTRAQFVTFLWRAANSPGPISTVNRFSDVSETTHKDYYKAILWAYQQGITTGTGSGAGNSMTFSPNEVVTRAQSVTFMYRYAQKAGIATKTGTTNFDDVTNAGAMASYYDAIGWAVANGITNGNSTTRNTFGPMETCNRGMMVTFLYRLFTDATA